MNRHIKMSLVLVTLMLTLALLLTGCGKTEELQAEIDNNKTDAESAISDAADKAAADVKAAADKAAADLEEAVDELTALITNGDAADAKAVADAVKALEAAIDAAEKAAADADALQAEELEESVAALEAAIAKAADDTLDAAEDAIGQVEQRLLKNDLDVLGQINGINTAIKAFAKTTDLNTKVSALETKLSGMINDLKDKVVALEDWDAATKVVVDKLDALDAKMARYDAAKGTYSADAWSDIIDAYNIAYIEIIRATSVGKADEAIDTFVKDAGAVISITDEIYNALEAIAVDDVEYPEDGNALVEVKALIDAVVNGTNDAAKAELVAYPVSETETVNLVDIYEEYVEEYETLIQLDNGSKLKDRMDAVIAELIVIDADLNKEMASIRVDYDKWAAIGGNSVDNIDGFAASLEAFEECEDRLVDLIAAKAEADAINEDIEAFADAVTATGGTLTNKKLYDDVKVLIEAWDAKYFAGDYAVEITDNTVNYQMVDHEAYAAAVEAFNASVADVQAAAKNFIETVKNIGDVDLFKWDEIEIADKYFDIWVDKAEGYAGVTSFDYLFDVNYTPSDYYKTLVAAKAELALLQSTAKADYDAALAKVTSTTTTIDIYSTELTDILAWYDKYCAKDADENVVFVNKTFDGVEFTGDIDLTVEGGELDGYMLDDTAFVGTEEYNKIVAIKDVLDTLVAAKKAEKKAVEDEIDALGTITTDSKAALDKAFANYEEWLNGKKTPTASADQFDIIDGRTEYVIDNYADLLAAKAEYDALVAEYEAIHVRITKIKKYVDQTSFTDADKLAEADAVTAEVEAIRDAIEAFEEHNDGIRGIFGDADYAVLDLADLAVYKCYAYFKDIADARADAKVDLATLTNVETDVFVDYLDDVVDSYANPELKAAKTEAEVDAIVALATDKIEGFAAVAAIYDAKVAEANGDATLLAELEISFEDDIIDKLIVAETVEDINNIVELADDQLDSILNANPIN